MNKLIPMREWPINFFWLSSFIFDFLMDILGLYIISFGLWLGGSDWSMTDYQYHLHDNCEASTNQPFINYNLYSLL